jgi:hypothetical protein
MRRIMTSGLALGLALATGACESFLDVNADPNSPQTAPPDITLPAVLATFSSGILGSWPATMSAEWMQQISFNSNNRGLARYDRYEMRDVDAGVLWDRAYTTVLSQSKIIMEQSAPKEEWAYDAIAKIMYAWTLSVATDVWGPVPNSQALNPDNPKPAYDDQKAVYVEIQRLLSEAIDELPRPNFPSRIPATNDLLYTGDLTRWLKLAHTLQAQMHLHLVYAPGETPATRAQSVIASLANGFSSNLDDADFRYAGVGVTPTNAQPWYIARLIPEYRLSQHYVELLRARSDPRLPATAERTTADAQVTYRGHKNGDPAGPAGQFSRATNYFAHDTASFAWITYSQARFMEAEARLIVAGPAAADAPYRAAIRANMEKFRPAISATAITTYLNALPSLTTVANPLAEIMREKYIANFLRFEAWNDWRRTGYPVLTPVAGALTSGIPQRFPSPYSELIDNRENVLGTGIPEGLAGMSTKVWWATTGPR